MLRIGSRAQVMHGNAKMTGGGLKKKDLKYNKHGKIVSKKMSSMAKKEKRLQRAGYTTRKGQFKLFQRQYGGEYGNTISQSFSVANRQKLKKQYSVGHELLTSPLNKEATNKSILDKLKNIKNSNDIQILLTSFIIKVLRSSLVPIEEEKLYTVIIDEINKNLQITEYKTVDGDPIMKDFFKYNFISIIVSSLQNNKLMYINVGSDNNFMKQRLDMAILKQIHEMNKLKNIQTSYGIIDERIVRDSIKDKILSHDYMQIWMGCYNEMYIKSGKPIVDYFKTYFKPYIDKLKSISNSCLIIVEPRIFSIYSTVNIGEEVITIKNVVDELKDINVYLIHDINNLLLNNIITNFENYILILNMVEYAGNPNPSKQIPTLLEKSLKSRMESNKKYTMHVSREGIPYLIAENNSEIDMSKKIISIFFGVFYNKYIDNLQSNLPNALLDPYIRRIEKSDRHKIGKFIKNSQETYKEFVSYTHPNNEICTEYETAKEIQLCNDIKNIRKIKSIDDVIISYARYNIEYIYIKIKNLPRYADRIRITIPKEYPSTLNKLYIKFEYTNSDNYKINREVEWEHVDDELVNHINSILKEIVYKNTIIGRLRKIKGNTYITAYDYLKKTNTIEQFLDFYWNSKDEKYRYPINVIKELYSNLGINGNYNNYYTSNNSITINKIDLKNFKNILNKKTHQPHANHV